MNGQDSGGTRRDVMKAMLAGLVATASGGAASAAAPAARTGNRALRGDTLIRNGYVLTQDAGIGDIEGGDVHIRGTKIVAVGRNLNVPGARIIDARNTIVLPGFVDTHWHMWTSIWRGLVLDGNVWGYFPLRKLMNFYTAQDHYTSVMHSAVEGLMAGFTTVHNYAHGIRSVEDMEAELRALDDSGIRARFGCNPLADEKPPYSRSVALKLRQDWAGSRAEDRLTIGLLSELGAAWESDVRFARDNGMGISAHGSLGGMFPPAVAGASDDAIIKWAEAGLLGPEALLIHVVGSRPETYRALAASGARMSLAPMTEAVAPMGIPPFADAMAAGVPLANIGLSVDVTAQSVADMFGIMRGALNATRMRTLQQYSMVPRQAIEMATLGGARCLGLADQVGSLTPGKCADVVLVRTDAINMMPGTGLDPTRLIVLCAQPANVDTVMVNGRIVKRNGRAVGIDVERVVADAADAQRRLRERAQLPPLDLKA
jgi:cytosine/adenosine deaminase-related metal-dependent hydrolase